MFLFGEVSDQWMFENRINMLLQLSFHVCWGPSDVYNNDTCKVLTFPSCCQNALTPFKSLSFFYVLLFEQYKRIVCFYSCYYLPLSVCDVILLFGTEKNFCACTYISFYGFYININLLLRTERNCKKRGIYIIYENRVMD